VDDLRAGGCDLVVCLAHLGESEDGAPNRACDVVAHVSGIDLVIDGHDHREEEQVLKDASGHDTLVVESECHSHMVGIVYWGPDGALEHRFVRHDDTDAQDGEVGINGEPALYHLLVPWQESEPQSYCVLQMVTSFRDAAYRLGEPSDPNVDLYSGEGLETLLYQVTHDYKPYTSDEKMIPPIKFTAEENEEMSVLKTNVASTIKQNMVAFFNGTKTVEADYDAFLADLEAQGLGKLVEMYQAAYDAQYK
jgi:hypothetical protein